MMDRYFFTPLLAAASLCCACSGGADPGKPSNAPSFTANTAAVAVSATDEMVNTNTGSANLAANDQLGTFANRPNRKKIVDMPAGERPVLRFENAGEDSEIAAAMNNNGQMYEVRIFRRHPQLVKVESTWIDPKVKALQIFLRNGQVLNITTDRIVNLKQATTAQLLAIAGLPAVPAMPKTDEKTGVKKVQ